MRKPKDIKGKDIHFLCEPPYADVPGRGMFGKAVILRAFDFIATPCESKRIRRYGEWLLKAADWLEEKKK